MGLWSVNKTVGCFDPSNKKSFSVRMYNMAVHSLISVECLGSACVNSLEIAEMRFILSVPLCECNNAAPIPKLKASHIALNGWSGSGICV